eukprot:NODE_7676_length_1558_cov_5.985325.p2 GENE.NODE_7676_length_1558_cov_5.985325~~NODE_7676_length_1558_cov_5.985325.p2  ORF type:complete len:190 (-),score=56.85 NODE_7676_length_1558_cov_5.985325:670-1239(-)
MRDQLEEQSGKQKGKKKKEKKAKKGATEAAKAKTVEKEKGKVKAKTMGKGDEDEEKASWKEELAKRVKAKEDKKRKRRERASESPEEVRKSFEFGDEIRANLEKHRLPKDAIKDDPTPRERLKQLNEQMGLPDEVGSLSADDLREKIAEVVKFGKEAGLDGLDEKVKEYEKLVKSDPMKLIERMERHDL